MITKAEVLTIAKQLSLLPNIIEKDYILGWLLLGISRHPLLSKWVFKGGTCLKKCYFETYRFSEDLDFTIPESEPYDKELYKQSIIECTEFIYQEAGIEFPHDKIEINESHDKDGRLTFEGKLPYIGPLQFRTMSQLPKVKLDLTCHEIIVDSTEYRTIYHPYSDSTDPSESVLCYSVNEILSEKTRAIYERQARARDIYDVVNLCRNYREKVNTKKAKNILEKKFNFKNLPNPTIELILSAIDIQTLTANWDHQLRHQLSFLPSVDMYIDELKTDALWWIAPPTISQPIPYISEAADEEVISKPMYPKMVYAVPLRKIGIGIRQAHVQAADYEKLNSIRFAARNRLCIELTYKGIRRLVEPYSLRRPQTGNILLYVYELKRGYSRSETIKAFKVNKITSVTITKEPFRARYAVEL